MSRPTPEDIEAAKTPAGGWTREQLAQWGVPWPPPVGWRDRLCADAALNRPLDDGDRPQWRSVGRASQDATRVSEYTLALKPHCDSPIEVMLGAHLRWIIAKRQAWAEALPQYRLQRFRYDFAIKVPGLLLSPIVLIECDGAEFHSTAAQIANDQKKDALAAEIGAAMFRFTGKDIVRDPHGCALLAFTEFMRRTANLR
jgi:very-short-patch-repair endonuclease